MPLFELRKEGHPVPVVIGGGGLRALLKGPMVTPLWWTFGFEPTTLQSEAQHPVPNAACCIFYSLRVSGLRMVASLSFPRTGTRQRRHRAEAPVPKQEWHRRMSHQETLPLPFIFGGQLQPCSKTGTKRRILPVLITGFGSCPLTSFDRVTLN